MLVTKSIYPYRKLKLYLCLIQLGVFLILLSVSTPKSAQAQWPPFDFRLIPSYADGKITYQITFRPKVDWMITDIAFNIPLPAGTRFVEAHTLPTTQATFDGAEVSFFTALSHRPIRDVQFVVEVIDPAQTIFTTHAWISWKGSYAGDYLTPEVPLDITLPLLNWVEPPESSVQLEARAWVSQGVVTYEIYPLNVVNRRRIWDLNIRLPLPAGATFLSAEAPATFVAGSNPQEVVFSTIELPSRVNVGPLRVRLSVPDEISAPLVTQAWASWKNAGRDVGSEVVMQEAARTGDIVVAPEEGYQVVSDLVGDVPFLYYDLTSVGLRKEGPTLHLIFHTAGTLGPVGEPLLYNLLIDRDCNAATGNLKDGRGLEYRIRYRHDKDRVEVDTWVIDAAAPAEINGGEVEAPVETAEIPVAVPTTEAPGRWQALEMVGVTHLISEQMISLQLPYDTFDDDGRFCWLAEVDNRVKTFASKLPGDDMPDGEDLMLTHFNLLELPLDSSAGAITTTTTPIENQSQ